MSALTVFSLGVFLAAAVLWVRSLWIEDVVYSPSIGGGVFSYRGRLAYEHRNPRLMDWSKYPSTNYECNDVGRDFDYPGVLLDSCRFHFAGFAGPMEYGWADFGFFVPYWFVAVVSGLLPGWRLKSFLRQRCRRRLGLCRVCGYDLRATPDPAGPRLARCPECGKEVVRAAGEGAIP